MRKITLKVIGLFMTVFAVSQLGQVEKASATTSEINGEKKSLETTNHGCGCGCGSCMESAETSATNS